MRLPVILTLLGLLASPAAAKVVTIDFDELGNPDDVFCGQRANVSYCDDNKYLYGHIGDYLLLSDYDWSASTSITADPGTVFTPLRFDVRNAFSAVWRLPCPDCAEPFDAYEVVETRADEFEIYDYDYLLIEGFRGDRRVASQSLDPGGSATVTLGTGFEDIDRLDLSLRGAYFEDAALEDDGYVYTCLLNPYSYCNSADIDDLVIETNAPIAPIPLGGAGVMLAGGLPLLGAVAMRRRARRARA